VPAGRTESCYLARNATHRPVSVGDVKTKASLSNNVSFIECNSAWKLQEAVKMLLTQNQSASVQPYP